MPAIYSLVVDVQRRRANGPIWGLVGDFLLGFVFFDIVEIIGRDAQAALVCFAVSV